MVFNDSSDDEVAKASEDVEGKAYMEQITSVDGFTRGPNGRIKFHKDTKKRRRDAADADDMDVDMDDTGAVTKQRPSKKRAEEAKLGKEFKAKVRS